jgi:uncharacterized protein YjbJ (UPF0337 family)
MKTLRNPTILKYFFVLETIGLASKTAADVTDQAKAKLDEVSGKAKKTAEKAKKKVKDAVDL